MACATSSALFLAYFLLDRIPSAIPRDILRPTSSRNTRDGEWMPNRLLRPSRAASPTLLAASMMVPMEFLRPFAIPFTMSLPICIQSNSKNLALTLVNTCGSFPTSSGMACMIPAASSPSNSIPFCRISGRWLAIVAIICISASAAAPITAGRFDRMP